MMIASPHVLLASPEQRVESQGGSIYLIDERGHKDRLTMGGFDTQPSLSADGKEVAYVRSRPSQTADDEGAVSEIRIINLVLRTDEVVFHGPAFIGDKRYSGFGTPRLSPDGKLLYFLFNWSATTHGLATLNLTSHEIKFLMPAVSFPAIVYRGKYRGDLIVLQRRPKLSLGDFLLYYLFAPNGVEIGVVGDSEFDVGIFIDPNGDVH